MKISFHGACREVTGSCILIENEKYSFLVDCGMFQDNRFSSNKNFEHFGFEVKDIDFVLLTHAHMDHCGRLPKLYKEGFRGNIYCTAATRDLAELMLIDSARIIRQEAAEHETEPLYTEDDVAGLSQLFKTIEYDENFEINKDIKVRLMDAGHILGSAIFEVWAKDGVIEKKLVFSGDLGNSPTPIIRDAEYIDGADVVCVESTYAGRVHESKKDGLKAIRQAITDSIGNHGVLMIPIFVLEKAQEILFELNYLIENKQVPSVPMFLDSPLAIKAIAVYKKYSQIYNNKAQSLVKGGDDLFNFPGLEYTQTREESKKINGVPAPKVILAGSGMCTGGRIPHHLKFNLGDPKSQLLIVSYQVEGSLGRKLLDGAREVEVDGALVRVRAKISALGCYSSHADHPHLMKWIKTIIKPEPKKIFVIHGEASGNQLLADDLRKKFGSESLVPEYGQKYEI